MDGYRAISTGEDRSYAEASQDDDCDDESDGVGGELPPARVGEDERRMQLRAYHLWMSLRELGSFPRIEHLTAGGLADFADHMVVLDFSKAAAEPLVMSLGGKLAEECGVAQGIRRLSDVPASSLLSRIIERYSEILAIQGPVGFEAEHVNQRGQTLACRGILLPCSNDGENIEQIIAVINWKEVADAFTMAGLMGELRDHLPEQEPLNITL